MKSITLSELKGVLQEQDLRLRRQRYAIPQMSIEDVIDTWVEPPELGLKFLGLLAVHPEFKVNPAGARHHHWWENGLEEHCKEMIGFCFDLLELYPGDWGSISRTDVIVAVILHDFAKVWTYVPITEEDRQKRPDKYRPNQQFKYAEGPFAIVDEESKTLLEISRFGIVPTEQQWSAVIFAEGGYSDRNFKFGGVTSTSNTVNSHNRLTVLLHLADMYSAQILGRSLAVDANSERPTLTEVEAG